MKNKGVKFYTENKYYDWPIIEIPPEPPKPPTPPPELETQEICIFFSFYNKQKMRDLIISNYRGMI